MDAVLISSYQGGHNEYYRFLIDELKAKGHEHVILFGGGGGVILLEEIDELERYGVEKIYHALDGQTMGIEGIADDIILRIKNRDSPLPIKEISKELILKNSITNPSSLSKQITFIEQKSEAELKDLKIKEIYQSCDKKESLVLGVTGPGGSGKSSFIDELINRFLKLSDEIQIGIITVDPKKRFTGGALLGDRIRFNSIYNDRVFFRSLSGPANSAGVSPCLEEVISAYKTLGFDLIIVETSGIGQGDSSIIDYSDKSIYVMTSEFGASTQLDKIDMLEAADHIVINKFEKPGSQDAYREIASNHISSKKLKVSHTRSIFELELPIYAVSSNQFNNPGINRLFREIIRDWKTVQAKLDHEQLKLLDTELCFDYGLIPNNRVHYLAQIADTVFEYKKSTEKEAELAGKCYSLKQSLELVDDEQTQKVIEKRYNELWHDLSKETRDFLSSWEKSKEEFSRDSISYSIQDKEYRIDLFTETLAGIRLPKIALPSFKSWEELVRFFYRENIPGSFPYTAGVFPFKRFTEDPKRQFAGEGSSERTNRRFHFLTEHDDAKRLSVAFDGITLYGEEPCTDMDIYGKIGESGVSISTMDEMDKMLKGFDLTDPLTSVSMTINAPAPIILAMYFMTAYKRELNGRSIDPDKISVKEKKEIRQETFQRLRGTVQADILKEDQAQNTCIFSIDFAMKMIGDVQEYLTGNDIKNFYSLSISGYHIAEAGANPITQLAFTLSNGFTYVEYFLKRGLKIDEFAPNLSFFFSNGMEAEYSVIGRVARRIWAIAIRDLYKGTEKSQKLKYHIQTSGRSLHAQEMDFNDIRSTLQALMAFYDNCNSLHTNSYDEAVSTPTEESVRRSMAIQMIIADEQRLTKNENPIQGAFVTEELTDLVEEAVLNEFYRISHRGGVIGAMEKEYQRNKIQEDSFLYEAQKGTGELPIIGVNKYINKDDDPYANIEVTRCPGTEKDEVLKNLEAFKEKNTQKKAEALKRLKETAIKGENIFEELLNTVEHASLGEITHVLYEAGGRYRRGI